jgi:hypothetical protein
MAQRSLGELPGEVRAALEAEFDPDEQVLWSGQPVPERVRKKVLVPLRVFAGVLLGIAAMITIPVGKSMLDVRHLLRDEDVSTSALLASVGGAAGLGVIVLGVLYAVYHVGVVLPRRIQRRAQRTGYALSNTRLLRVECRDRHEPSVESYEPSHPLHIARKPYKDGTADVIVGPRFTTEPAAPRQVSSGAFTLEAIRDARAIDRNIRATFDPTT